MGANQGKFLWFKGNGASGRYQLALASKIMISETCIFLEIFVSFIILDCSLFHFSF